MEREIKSYDNNLMPASVDEVKQTLGIEDNTQALEIWSAMFADWKAEFSNEQ